MDDFSDDELGRLYHALRRHERGYPSMCHARWKEPHLKVQTLIKRGMLRLIEGDVADMYFYEPTDKTLQLKDAIDVWNHLAP